MANIRVIFNTSNGSGIYGSFTEKFDDVIRHNFSLTNSAHSHQTDNFSDNDGINHKMNLSGNCTQIGTGVFRCGFWNNSATVLLVNIDLPVKVGTFSITAYFLGRPSGFVQNRPPTYLEELHKLDRTSSSHYIPR